MPQNHIEDANYHRQSNTRRFIRLTLYFRNGKSSSALPTPSHALLSSTNV